MTTTVSTHAGAPTVTARQVPLPADARALSTLTRIDYADAFTVASAAPRTPQEWVQAMLGDAPLLVRARLVAGWTALGLKLGPPWTGHRVLGWTVLRSDPEVLLLAAGSRLGLQGELLFRGDPGGLLFATFVQIHNPVARAVWARVIVRHQHVVGALLTRTARRVVS